MTYSDKFTPEDRISKLLYTLGNAYLDRQQYPEAFEKFQQLIERGIDDAELLQKAAVAGIGSTDISENALYIYRSAIEKCEETKALTIGIATLFAQNNVISDFSIDICEQAVELKPNNEQRIRLFLKKAYETQGISDKVYEHEQKVIFGSQNKKAIRSYLESLWWQQKFEEAHKAISTAFDPTNKDNQFDIEKALTYAYQLLSTSSLASNKIEQAAIESAAHLLKNSKSIMDFRNYLTLRATLPDTPPEEKEVKKEIDEYQFILGNMAIDDVLHASNGAENGVHNVESFTDFDFRRDVLNILKQTESQNSFNDLTAKCIGFTQIFTHGANQISEKLVNLVEEHLKESDFGLTLRRIGIGFLVLSQSPEKLIKTLVRLLEHLETYNQKALPNDCISLLVSVYLTDLQKHENDRSRLITFLEAIHLLRVVELGVTKDAGAGSLLIAGTEKSLKRLPQDEISMIKRGPIEIMPHLKTPYFEVLWRMPLLEVEQGETYSLGRFDINKCLTKHRNYATYSAFDEQLSRTVLVKILQLRESINIMENPTTRDKLLEQIRGIGRLNHPHIANLYDMGEHKNMFYFVREYVEGKPLSEIQLDENERENVVLGIVQKLVRALAYAQRNGIVHLNLKPGNIWINEAQEINITDFRLIGFSEDGKDGKILFPGYWRYVAPEILHSDTWDFRSDIYSVGVICYELLAGKHPYTTTAAIKGPKDLKQVRIAPLSEHCKLKSQSWVQFIQTALAANPDDRFASYSQIDMELRKIQMELMQEALDAA